MHGASAHALIHTAVWFELIFQVAIETSATGFAAASFSCILFVAAFCFSLLCFR